MCALFGMVLKSQCFKLTSLGEHPGVSSGVSVQLAGSGLLPVGQDDAGHGTGHEQDTDQAVHPHAIVTGFGQVEALGVDYGQRCIIIPILIAITATVTTVIVQVSVLWQARHNFRSVR